MNEYKEISAEMRFCRRCGSELKVQNDKHVFVCQQGHLIFLNASPAVGVVLFNDKDEVIILERAIDPGKGLLDIPGGFCDGSENLEEALAREIKEEIGLAPDQYDPPQYVSSGIDPYDFKGEVLPVLGVIFEARLRPGAQPVAADDAASAEFITLHDIDMSRVYFPAVRKALGKLLDKYA
jgi:ADP-ribose pyrophosphatase YjhB (NUDIX family)